MPSALAEVTFVEKLSVTEGYVACVQATEAVTGPLQQHGCLIPEINTQRVKPCPGLWLASPSVPWVCVFSFCTAPQMEDQGFRIVVLEKTLESPLDSKETKSVNPKGNQL